MVRLKLYILIALYNLYIRC